MPELPEVETIKNALVKAIKGAKILNTEVFCRKFRVQIPDGFEYLLWHPGCYSIFKVN